MNFITPIFYKDTEIIQEVFTHIAKYSTGEIIVTDEKLNIIFQNTKYIFKNGKFLV